MEAQMPVASGRFKKYGDELQKLAVQSAKELGHIQTNSNLAGRIPKYNLPINIINFCIIVETKLTIFFLFIA